MLRIAPVCLVVSQFVLVHAQAESEQQQGAIGERPQHASAADEKAWSELSGWHEVTDVTFHGVHKAIALPMGWRISPNGGSVYQLEAEEKDGGEMSGTNWGRATVDATKEPMWLTFRYRAPTWTREAVLRCIFKVDEGWITIALPASARHGHYKSERPTSFDSTKENKYVVMKMATAATQNKAFAIKADRERARARNRKLSP